MTYQTLTCSVDAYCATITLNRPDKLNALNALLLSELHDLMRSLALRDDVRCVIVTGSGPKAFAAGADIAELAACSVEQGRAFSEYGQSVFRLIEDFPVPVIAAVNGFALGGGCELAMACHIRIASDTARFGQPEVKLGTIPGYGGTQRLFRLCGSSVAIELMTSGDMINAERALQSGLVSSVVPAADLLAYCSGLASRISSMAPLAVRAVLDAVRPHFSAPDDFARERDRFADLCGTDDFREGTSAFLEKRSPSFRGS